MIDRTRRSIALSISALATLAALPACDGTLGTSTGGGGGQSASSTGGATGGAGASTGAGGLTGGVAGTTGGAGGSTLEIRSATNPVLGIDHPDPDVLRAIAPDGKPIYYMTVTGGNSGDLPVFTSRDLLLWTPGPTGLFQNGFGGAPVHLNGAWFCNLWAPALREAKPGVFLLAFTAQRFAANPGSCPPYADDSGVYLASAAGPLGPFAPSSRPWEPFPAGANEGSCPKGVRDAIPKSVDYASGDCQGGYCDNVVRLDGDFFFDPATGRNFMAYAWYTNTPPKVAWETTNYGEHVSIVELDGADPFAVRCDPGVAKVFAANPHDGATLDRLAQSCPGCGEMLSMTKGRFDEELSHDGAAGWGVVEGPSLFRRGEYVYLLVSGSAWDSAYYHVFWVAAKSVEELAYDNPGRLVGRYLIPSGGQSFGHGTAVLGPDGEHWYFVHHRLDHGPCASAGACQRDVWVSPIEFEDRGDGLGEVYIRARRPAESPGVSVAVP